MESSFHSMCGFVVFNDLFFVFEKELKQLLQLVWRRSSWNRKAYLTFAISHSLSFRGKQFFAALLLVKGTTRVWQWGVIYVMLAVLGPIILGQGSWWQWMSRELRMEIWEGEGCCQQGLTYLWSVYVCLGPIASPIPPSWGWPSFFIHTVQAFLCNYLSC